MQDRMGRAGWVAVVFLVAMITCGCDRGPQKGTVAGSVTLDGTPLTDASIHFDACDGTMPASLPIVDGSFSGEVVVGDKTVRIIAMRATARDPNMPATDVVAPEQNVLPDRYGHSSELKLNVTTEPTTDLRYELESK